MKARYILIAVVLALWTGMAARAEQPTRDISAQGRTTTRLGPFPALAPEVEYVYVNEALCALETLRLHRGCEPDRYFDWTMGREYTFRPWDIDSGEWRAAWAQTPGERFATWWVGFCLAGSCEACEGTGCAEIQTAMAVKFDVALSAVTAR
jgi:hypothetical protein